MSKQTVEIKTNTTICKTEIFTPAGDGPWPAVIVCFDAFGVRPAISEIAARISSWGYVAVIPDFYHDAGDVFGLLPPGAPHNTKALMGIFADQELRAKWAAKFYTPAISYEHLENDIAPLFDYFSKRSDIEGGVGTTGYCMGGNMTMRIATIFGDKIKATAGFHPGGLVTPAPDSPHLRVGKIKSPIYLGPAVGDLNEEQEKELDQALTLAHVDHKIETYQAKHGYAVEDHDAYDAAAAERHYEALKKFYAETLGKKESK
ncbi:MAG: dienelactone hydrolase family protein [Polyangiaceae bacterium]